MESKYKLQKKAWNIKQTRECFLKLSSQHGTNYLNKQEPKIVKNFRIYLLGYKYFNKWQKIVKHNKEVKQNQLLQGIERKSNSINTD